MGGGILNIAKILGIFVPSLATATTANQVLAVGIRGIGIAMRFAFPVGALLSVAALGFGYLWEKCEWFREGFLALWESLKKCAWSTGRSLYWSFRSDGRNLASFFDTSWV